MKKKRFGFWNYIYIGSFPDEYTCEKEVELQLHMDKKVKAILAPSGSPFKYEVYAR